MGTTPSTLNETDYRALGARTEGYSGADIAVLVRDALMQPVRKVQQATHFKHATGSPFNDAKAVRTDMLVPCSPGRFAHRWL